MNRPRSLIVALVVAGILAPVAEAGRLWADDLRTIMAGIATVSADTPDGVHLAMGYNDAIAVVLAKDTSFVQGFEIELRLPQAAIGLPGGFAYELWRKIEPFPDKKRYGYSGERIITQPIPPRAGIVLQIPIRKDFSIKPSPYAFLIPTVVEAKDFPFVFKLLPVAKGFGSEIESAQFQVRVRPILGDDGALSLKIRYPEGSTDRSLTVTVDDKRVDPSATLILPYGPHQLQVSSESYRDESRSFAIEQGKTLELVVELQDTTPIALIEAPDSAIVLIDGVRIDHDVKPQLTLDPGDHTVTCRIGDYTITRKFTAFRGKTYRLVLAIDLQIQETQ